MLVNILFLRKVGNRGLAALFCTQKGQAFLPTYKYQTYFKPKIHKFTPLAKSIIEMLASTDCNISTLKSKLDSYRHNDQQRHPREILVMLCALNDCKHPQVRSFGRHLIQFIIRAHDFSQYTCDRNELSAVLAQFSQKRSQSFEKIKQALVMYKLAELLIANQNVINLYHFNSIINILIANDRLTVVTSTRFLKLAGIFTKKMLQFMKEYNQTSYHNNFVEKMVNPSFIINILNYLKEYPTGTDEEAKILFQFFNKTILSNDMGFRKIIVYNIHRNFPYSSKNSEGQYYKDVILKKIIERSKKKKDHGEDWNQSLFQYSILSFQFYKTMDSLEFRHEDGLNYLKKQDIRAPQLPSIYWESYQSNPKLTNKDHIARNIIKRVYPQRYISTPDLQSSTIKPPKITENEIKIRTMNAFQKLGLKWQREVEIGGRYVDFLVGDIIIECDGDYHFDLYKMDYNESTQFRNLHILLSGYKLLIFNIFQYNSNRSTDQLAQLINRKLTYLKKNDAVMIL